MQPKVLITIRGDAADIEASARQFAVAVATAIGADEGGDLLVGPINTIMQGRALQMWFGRSEGVVVTMNIAPDPLAIRTPTAREQFRRAVIEALEPRYGTVRAFSSIRSLIDAANSPAPQYEVRALH
jgi:hypothetical protein